MSTYKNIIIAMVLMVSMVITSELYGQESRAKFLNRKPIIKRIYIDRSSSHDPGTIVAILKNSSIEQITIGEITVNGVVVKEWPAPSDPILWHRITSSVIQPEQTGLILLKLAQYNPGMIRLTINIGDKKETTLLNASDSEKVRPAAIRYDPSGKYVNVFVSNNGVKDEILKSIELNNQIMWTASDTGLVIKPGMTEVACINFKDVLKAGMDIQLILNLEDRIIGVRNRAIPGFRISTESGDQEMAQRIAADPLVLDSFQFSEEQSSDEASHSAPSLLTRQGAKWKLVHVTHGGPVSEETSDLTCVFACPTHATDSYHTSAYLAMMAQKEVEKQPCWQSFIHACRSQPLQGLAMFGTIADCVRFNGQLKTEILSVPDNRDEVPWTVYQFVQYAVASAAPSLAMPMIPVEKDQALFPNRAPLSLEARQMAYAALSAGAGGLTYRIMEKDWGKESRDVMIDEITRVNHEIQQIRDYLAAGFPRPIVNCEVPTIQATCIDAMPKGMILILINHDLQRSASELPPSVIANEHNNVKVTITRLNGIKSWRVCEIYDTQNTEYDNTYTGNENGQLDINIPKIGATKLLLIKPTQSQINNNKSNN